MLRVVDVICPSSSSVNEIHDALLRQLPSSVWRHFAHRAINRNKTAVQGVGDELNTDLADLTDAMRVDDFKQKQDKNTLWGNSHASSH